MASMNIDSSTGAITNMLCALFASVLEKMSSLREKVSQNTKQYNLIYPAELDEVDPRIVMSTANILSYDIVRSWDDNSLKFNFFGFMQRLRNTEPVKDLPQSYTRDLLFNFDKGTCVKSKEQMLKALEFNFWWLQAIVAPEKEFYSSYHRWVMLVMAQAGKNGNMKELSQWGNSLVFPALFSKGEFFKTLCKRWGLPTNRLFIESVIGGGLSTEEALQVQEGALQFYRWVTAQMYNFPDNSR